MYPVKPLPYPYNELEPQISSDTLHYHHDKHYQKYVDNLNKALEANNKTNMSVVDIVKHIDEFPIQERGTILFNAGGVLNHELYFDTMGESNHTLMGSFKEAILKEYGSQENFEKTYIEEAQKLVGSGYTFLVLNKENQLEIINTANQDTPYSYGLIPVMTIDLWEHAYYLDYQNRRDDYIKAFFQIVDYKKVEEAFEKAKQELPKNV